MKKIIIILLLTSFFFTSCFKEQMDITPTDLLTPEKVFSTEEGAETALVGVYSRFSPGWYYYHVIMLEAYGNKDWYPGSNQGAVLALYETHIMPSSLLAKPYKRLWSTITFANAFLVNLEKYNTPYSSESRREQAIAQAKMLRAFVYFELVQIWGPVPLITDEKDYGILYPSNATISEIYTQIITDLEYCIEKLPAKGTEGYELSRVTKGAAQGILAKVLMSQKDAAQKNPPTTAELQRAVDLMSDVMSQYSLVENYDDLWHRATFNNSENIFAAVSSNEGKGNGIHWPKYASHDYEPTESFYNSFDNNVEVNGTTYTDVRRESTVHYELLGNKFRDNKYRRAAIEEPGDPNHTVANLYILRLSDIILLKAEALNKLGYEAHKDEIFELINSVRNRAGAIPATETDYPNQAAMALAIEEERHKELFFEFQEFFDLKRNNRLIEVLGTGGVNFGFDNDYQRLWPFPESEINKNHNLKQNPGY